MYATLRVVVDPDGYAAGLSSSFVPNLGIAPVSESIEKEQAEEIVRQQFPDIELEYYTEQTHKNEEAGISLRLPSMLATEELTQLCQASLESISFN